MLLANDLAILDLYGSNLQILRAWIQVALTGANTGVISKWGGAHHKKGDKETQERAIVA